MKLFNVNIKCLDAVTYILTQPSTGL